MPLAKAIQNSRHTGQLVTFQREDGSGVVDLTNVSAITYRIRNVQTGVTVDGTGTCTPVAPLTNGQFTWAYGVADVATKGENYMVQFKATYADASVERSQPEPWVVVEAY